ncbi:MAG: permease [Chloroflexia bacterium]|nr:permease [Chloroflexia bacterium]
MEISIKKEHSRKYLLLSLGAVFWALLYFKLDVLTNFLIYKIIGLESGTHLADSIWFFVFEVPKVFLLLILIIFIVGVVRSYFSAEKTKKKLEGKPLFVGNIMAALLGIVTPFCSCSAIPMFLGFVEAGIPLGVTFSFLIAAPMINEVAVVLLLGLFGWKVTLIYVLTGLFIAILSGYLLEKLRLQKYVADWVFKMQAQKHQNNEQKATFNQRIGQGITLVKEIIGKIWIYIVAGIAIGAGAHGYVPQDYLAGALGNQNWYSVLLAIVVGVPLYSNAAGIIPIVSVLIEKGVTLGTALAFMMSVIGLSLPEIVILKKVLKWQLIAVFIGVVATGIIIVGYLFNYVIFI